MTRLARSLLPDGTYHAMARGVAETPIYRDDDDRLLFLRYLADVVARFGWDVSVLCLMGTHYHLVLTSTREALSGGMQRLNGRYADAYNARYDRAGHLFGDRFACRVVEDEAYLERLCAYVRENPVRAGLCAHADDWPWSWSRLEPAATARAAPRS